MTQGPELNTIQFDTIIDNSSKFDNMYDDYDYDGDLGPKLTLESCKEQYLNATNYFQENYPEGFCRVTFDSLVCWPPTRFNDTATVQCFARLFEIVYDSTQNATRFCSGNGTWSKQNFSMCTEVLELPDDLSSQTTTYFVGFTLSLITLTVAVGIFMSFKDLRCLRNKIHINLMWSYILMYFTWIAMLILINYRHESIIFCGFGTMMLHYSHVSTFFWMFVEGMYLYILVVKTLTREIFKLRVYICIGWGVPFLFIIIWAVVKWSLAKATDDLKLEDKSLREINCPWLQSDRIDWIYLAPPLLVIFLNVAFLISIMWVLISKLRSSPTVVEHKQHYKAARALLVLMPLLGITWAVTIYVPSGAKESNVFEFLQTILLSTQGLMIALFYCFLNTEVQNTIRHHFDNWKARRSLGPHSRNRHRTHTEWTLVHADEIEAPNTHETNMITTTMVNNDVSNHQTMLHLERSNHVTP